MTKVEQPTVKFIQIIAADWRSPFHLFALDEFGQAWGYLGISKGWMKL